jgi:hypothetical protein
MAWFRRNKDDLGSKYVAVFELVLRLLNTERTLIEANGKFLLENEDGSINGPALGFAYGVADAALHVSGLELANEHGRRLLSNLFESCAKGKGEYYLQYMIHNMQRDEVAQAVKRGGETFLAVVNSKGKAPMWGWGRYFGMGRSR